jgi:hypothetical protein
MVFLPLGCQEKNKCRSAPLQEPARNFLEQVFTIIALFIRNGDATTFGCQSGTFE